MVIRRPASRRARAARSFFRSLGLLSALALLGACSSKSAMPKEPDPDADTDADADAPVITGDIPCDPDRVLQTVCQKCHTNPPQNGAPFPLVTYGDTQTVNGGKPIWQYMLSVVESGIMPLPPVQIDPGDRDTLLHWLEAGAPAKTATDTCTSVLVDPEAGTVLDPDSGAGDEAPATAGDDGGSDADGSPTLDAAGADPDAADGGCSNAADATPE